MKLVPKLLLLIGLTIALVFHKYQLDKTLRHNQYTQPKKAERSDFLACQESDRKWTKSMPYKFLGPSLTSSDHERLILCPGDAFGDLNNTYLVMKNCNLKMYHKDQLVWSAIKPRFDDDNESDIQQDCMLILEHDGNLRLYEGIYLYFESGLISFWSSWTPFQPLKTELRVQDQQFQILQTFGGDTQRLFYVSEKYPKMMEDMGKPKKVGSSGFVKSHTDKNPTILRRNEYIGDLNGLYLILQTNCGLTLMNKNRTIWSFEFELFTDHVFSCSLTIEEGKRLLLSNTSAQYEWPSSIRVYMQSCEPQTPQRTERKAWNEPLMIQHSFQVLESQFILKDDQLIIAQTLENRSQLIFESQSGQRIGLLLRKKPRQIAKNNLVIPKSETSFIFERMDYIGDLNGLHLILQSNCTLMLANGQETLWQYSVHDSFFVCMECFITFSDGILFIRFSAEKKPKPSDLKVRSFQSGEITVNNNHLIITVDGEDSLSSKKYSHILEKSYISISSNKYYAGPNTHGDLSMRLSERSLVMRASDDSALEIPKIAHLGDLNGVYARFEQTCNWALYNQSQLLWESGTYIDRNPWICSLYLQSDGTLAIFDEKPAADQEEGIGDKGICWSTQNTTKNFDPSKKLETSELLIENDWLWLTNTFQDGTVEKFKALEGTNSFIAV